MNEQLIRDIVDISANKQVEKLTSDLEKNNKLLQDNIVSAKQFNDIISQSKGFSDFNKNAAASAKQQEQLAKLTASRQLAEERLASFRAQEQAKADLRARKEQENLAKIEAANNKAAEAARRRAQLVSESTSSDLAGSSSTGGNNTGTTVNAVDVAAANAANSITAETGAIERNTEAGNDNARTRRQLAVAAEQERLNNIANTRAIRLEARERNAAQGSLEQRRAALIRLQGVFDNLNEQERASPFGQRLQRLLPQLNDQVLALERSTGRSQRNVGNYFQQAFNGLRTIANILPGVGIAGLLAFATEPLLEYIQQLDVFKKSAREAINETALQSSEYSKAVSDINKLKVSIQEFQSGTISKRELVDRYNESLGQTVGKLNSAQEVEAFYNSKAGDFVNAMLLRSRAAAALQKATEDAVKVQERASSGPSFMDKTAAVFANLPEILFPSSVEELDKTLAKVNERSKQAQNMGVKSLEKNAKDSFAIFAELQKEADKYANKNGFNFRNENNRDGENAARKAAQALIQIQIDNNKEALRYYQEGLENQQFSLDARLEQLKNFSDVSVEILRLEGEKEKKGRKMTADEIIAIDNDTKSKQIKVREDAANQVLVITRQSNARIKAIIDEQNQKDLTDTERMRDIELASLTKALNDGLIGQTEYDQKRKKIENDYTEFYIGLQIKQTQAAIDAAKLRGENTEDAEAKLAAIKLKYLELTTDKQKQANAELDKEADELAQREIDRRQKVQEIANELFELGRTIGNAVYTRRINQIENEKTALTERTAFEIEQVNDSVLAESEKADKIAIINARAQSNQALLDEKIKQEKIKQARFDKAAAIASIIMNTAVAVTKTLAVGLGFFSQPLAILTAALGAIQLGAVLATPIPQYKDGKSKSNKYSGSAIVGDGGMSELIIEPDGRMYVTPNTPTLTNVGRDTQVVSGPDFKRMLAKPNTNGFNSDKGFDVSPLLRDNNKQTSKIVKALNSQMSHNTQITEKGFRAGKARADKNNSWYNKNFR